ncbi:MAG: TetR/AcrR family transcriptional regulator [Candidatus Marinimicrobia bacterium]|nr:TetR/AcrR family transcriptional regulator [FCB group bacterium]MBL7024424.1 TetR/AcrR family transcriptional regulator [Candidatus Neomarinimicrobiota bacterium]
MTLKTFPSEPATNTPEEHILAHGLRSIINEGVRGFTVESLARELAMSKKTIYKYFPTKERLLREIFLFVSGRVTRWIQELVNRDANPIEKFQELVLTITKNLTLVSPTRFSDIKARHPALWREIEQFRLDRRDDFLILLQDAQNQGYIRKSLEVELTATLFMNIINSVFQPEFFLNNRVTPAHVAETFLDIFLRGLMTEKGLKHLEESK